MHDLTNETVFLDPTPIQAMLPEIFDPVWATLLLFLLFRLTLAMNLASHLAISRLQDLRLLGNRYRSALFLISLPPEYLFFGLIMVESIPLVLPIGPKEQLHFLCLLLSILGFNALGRPLDIDAHLEVPAQL